MLKAWLPAIKPFYSEPKGAGRRPIGIERMPAHLLSSALFSRSAPAAAEAIYEAHAMHHLVGINLGNEPAPDATTTCKFRHLMKKHNRGNQLFHFRSTMT